MIIVKCECGDVELLPKEIKVFKLEQSPTEPPSMKHFYRFLCRTCKIICVKETDENVTDILSANGVKSASDITFPPEVLEPIRSEPGSLHDLAIDYYKRKDCGEVNPAQIPNR